MKPVVWIGTALVVIGKVADEPPDEIVTDDGVLIDFVLEANLTTIGALATVLRLTVADAPDPPMTAPGVMRKPITSIGLTNKSADFDPFPRLAVTVAETLVDTPLVVIGKVPELTPPGI